MGLNQQKGQSRTAEWNQLAAPAYAVFQAAVPTDCPPSPADGNEEGRIFRYLQVSMTISTRRFF
jgi:hypothetical protein